MTCCVGKARIYYREPLNYWLTYQLPDGSFGSVTANEPLTGSCISVPPGEQKMRGVTYRLSDGAKNFIGDLYAPAEAWIGAQYATFNFYSHMTGFSHPEGDPRREFKEIRKGNYGSRTLFGARTFPLNPILQEVFNFKVTGETSGTEYANIGGLEECPTVISNICLMGEESYYDTLLPDQSPGGLVESSCFKKVADPLNSNCFHVVLETKYKKIPGKGLPLPPKTRSQLYLCGLPGCPAEYRIECCPSGECEAEKCPPDTDCQLDCGDFICCYKDGRVIKTIYK